MAEPNVLTFQDVLDHLADFFGGGAQDVEQRLLRRAVVNAYQRLIGERSWQYLYGQARINLVANYNTGTLTYTHTGGAS